MHEPEPEVVVVARVDGVSLVVAEAEVVEVVVVVEVGGGQHKLEAEEVSEGGGGVKRELAEVAEEELLEDGMKRLSNDAARVLVLLLLL